MATISIETAPTRHKKVWYACLWFEDPALAYVYDKKEQAVRMARLLALEHRDNPQAHVNVSFVDNSLGKLTAKDLGKNISHTARIVNMTSL